MWVVWLKHILVCDLDPLTHMHMHRHVPVTLELFTHTHTSSAPHTHSSVHWATWLPALPGWGGTSVAGFMWLLLTLISTCSVYKVFFCSLSGWDFDIFILTTGPPEKLLVVFHNRENVDTLPHSVVWRQPTQKKYSTKNHCLSPSLTPRHCKCPLTL